MLVLPVALSVGCATAPTPPELPVATTWGDRRLRSPGRPMGIGWSPDGQRLAVVGDYSVRVMDIPDGTPVLTLTPCRDRTGNLMRATWSPDATQLTVGCWETEVVFRVADGAELHRSALPPEQHGNLDLTGRTPKEVKVGDRSWRIARGEAVTLEVDGGPPQPFFDLPHLSVNPTGTYVLGHQNGSHLWLFDADGAVVRSSPPIGHPLAITSTPDGSHVGTLTGRGEVTVFDVVEDRVVWSGRPVTWPEDDWDQPGWASIALSGKGRDVAIVASGYPGARVELATGTVHALDGHGSAVAFGIDGVLFEVKKGYLARAGKGVDHATTVASGQPVLAWGHRTVSGWGPTGPALWEASWPRGAFDRLITVGVSSDGPVALGMKGKAPLVGGLPGPLHPAPRECNEQAAINTLGTVLACARGSEAVIVDPLTGAERFRVPLDATSYALHVSADGRLLASLGGDGSVSTRRLVDVP